jgi:hypothetical protein
VPTRSSRFRQQRREAPHPPVNRDVVNPNPAFGQQLLDVTAAHKQGVRSCLGLPLSSPFGLIGCYNFYSVQRDGFVEESREQLEVFAGNAAGAVAVALKLATRCSCRRICTRH